jgi:hypothetical protein
MPNLVNRPQNDLRQISADFDDIIMIDLDGVLARFDGWAVNANKIGVPVPGAVEAVKLLSQKYRIVIFTARAFRGWFNGRYYNDQTGAVRRWLELYKIPYYDITYCKIPALIYIDDRSLTFEGDWPDMIERINSYREWYR